MNKNRRDKIKTIIENLSNVITLLNGVYNEEEFAFDNIPENLQGGIRAETIEEGLEAIEEAIDDLNSAREKLEDLI